MRSLRCLSKRPEASVIPARLATETCRLLPYIHIQRPNATPNPADLHQNKQGTDRQTDSQTDSSFLPTAALKSLSDAVWSFTQEQSPGPVEDFGPEPVLCVEVCTSQSPAHLNLML